MATLKERLAQVREAQDNPTTAETYLKIPHTKGESVELLQEEPIKNPTVASAVRLTEKNTEEMEALKTRWEKICFLANVARAGVTSLTWLIFIACVNSLAIGFTIFLLGKLL